MFMAYIAGNALFPPYAMSIRPVRGTRISMRYRCMLRAYTRSNNTRRGLVVVCAEHCMPGARMEGRHLQMRGV